LALKQGWNVSQEPSEEFTLKHLRPKVPATVPAELLLAVGEVTLAAGNVSRRALRDFYEKMLGLTFVAADENVVRFRHHQQRIVLERGAEIGKVGLLIRGFGAAMEKLQRAKVSVEVLHTDGGLTPTAILRDPAGNWVHLLETRGF
jgi:hypothetical protein